MRVFEYEYKDIVSFGADLKKLKKWCDSRSVSNVLFHVYTTSKNNSELDSVLQTITDILPESIYVGASTSGNIINGELSPNDISVTATVFEDKDTTVSVYQYSFTEDTIELMADQIVTMVNNDQSIKAVEFLVTLQGLSMSGMCSELSKIREEVNIYGGAALNNEMNDDEVIVYSSKGEITDKSVVFVLYGGSNIRTDAFFVGGWNPLGRKIKITRAERNRLYELDGMPAYDIFHNYLGIANDESFFVNSLEFPLLMNINDVDILRAPTKCNDDGSILMTADMKEGAYAHLSYGDPKTILKTVNQYGQRVQAFDAQAVYIFSCAARKTFWGGSSQETKPFVTLAPTTGLYTAGEFVRTGRNINLHNVTMVVVSMSECAAGEGLGNEFRMPDSAMLEGQISLVNRLASFIDKATEELEAANLQLSVMAITDGMTHLFNRMETQKRISNEVMTGATSGDDSKFPSLIMIDIDNFKAVNDCCGHSEGDRVIKSLAAMIRSVLNKRISVPGAADTATGFSDTGPCAGRWGGEEFMILLPHTSIVQAHDIAEAMRSEFNCLEFPQAGYQTISLGVARAVRGENVDMLCGRVDKALYEAKKTGKNKVVVK